jgi:hypothetical protein
MPSVLAESMNQVSQKKGQEKTHAFAKRKNPRKMTEP